MKLEKKLIFIFNPKAGKGKIKTSLMDIVDIFNKGGYEVIIRATQAPRDAYEQVKKYADKVDLVVCSGGDGTLAVKLRNAGHYLIQGPVSSAADDQVKLLCPFFYRLTAIQLPLGRINRHIISFFR